MVDGKKLFRIVRGKKTGALRKETFHESGCAREGKTEKWKYIAVRYPPKILRRITSGKKFPSFKENLPQNPLPYLVANLHLGYHSSRHNPNYFQADQLYDLENDPYEKTNVLGLYPEVVTDLKARLTRHLATFPRRPFGEFTH